MDLEIILIYSFCSDLLKLCKHQNDSQCKMNTAEVMTVVITAGLYFGGNQALARRFLSAHKYIPKMLSESRLNRRLHKIDPAMWQIVFNSLKTLLKQSANLLEYVVDSFPIQACAKARSYRCKLLSGKHFIGYCASKNDYYYGVKVHMIATTSGLPIEFIITPGSVADITALRLMDIDLPWGSCVYADRAYSDYSYEDFLREAAGISLIPQRKACLKRQHSGPLAYIQSIMRKRIETMFSQITRLFPKSIHATTRKGFLLKILLFIISFSFAYQYFNAGSSLDT